MIAVGIMLRSGALLAPAPLVSARLIRVPVTTTSSILVVASWAEAAAAHRVEVMTAPANKSLFLRRFIMVPLAGSAPDSRPCANKAPIPNPPSQDMYRHIKGSDLLRSLRRLRTLGRAIAKKCACAHE